MTQLCLTIMKMPKSLGRRSFDRLVHFDVKVLETREKLEQTQTMATRDLRIGDRKKANQG